MASNRTASQRIADWREAYVAIQAELTPAPLRAMMTALTATVPPEGTDDIDQVRGYIERVNAAAGISRMVFANDRAAGVMAAMLTQSGISRPVLDVIEGGES